MAGGGKTGPKFLAQYADYVLVTQNKKKYNLFVLSNLLFNSELLKYMVRLHRGLRADSNAVL